MSSPISGFTAIPNPQMLAFMPIQSYLMMYFAGSGWQYGKRRISAMSNEQFNKLTPEELLQQHSIELKNMLPTLDKTLNDVTPLIRTLVEQYGDFVREAIKAIPDAIGNIFQGTSGNVQQSQFGITQVRLDQSSQQFQRNPQARQETKDYWEQVARDAWKHASEIASPRKVPTKVFKNNITPISKFERGKLFGKQPTSQLGIIESQRQTKRKAGQSQKLERERLIKLIRDWGLLVKKYPRNIQYTRVFKHHQQSMINLLSRYQF